VRQLFGELADLPPAEREKILAERRIPWDICAEVESLLDHDSTSGNALTRRVSSAAQAVLASDDGPLARYCGPYRLVRLLGSGGMGSVYLAERRDGEIERKVAVKLLRSDAGDRPAWRDRFLRERQILAYLNHPSIARLFDAGHTSDGQPYLVMEYVDGRAIDEYAARLDLAAQLRLFLLVCEGVSHAHRHLIVHRDLKPSNILVDSTGHPKLLDFGIGKLLDPANDEDETQTIERAFTPGYASPEQLRGDLQSTATDIYSLGAVLYRLLTGSSPHESVPEARLTNWALSGDIKIADPSRLNPRLPRDIDHILRKALRDEPEERYPSVEAFANDIRAFLESRPVQARSGGAWYKTRKFLRRFWMPVSAVTLVLATLLVGIWLVNRERLIAQQRFLQVRQLANALFNIDVEVRKSPGTTKARQLIVATALDYLKRLMANSGADPDLALEVGTAYLRVARVQGVPINTNLGQMDDAEQNLRTAETLIRSVLAAQPANRTAFIRFAQIAHDRMVLAQHRRPNTEALPLAYESDRWLQKYLSAGKIDEAEKLQVVIIGQNVANWYMRQDQIDRGLRLLRSTIDIANATNQPVQAGSSRIVMARGLRAIGDLDGALAAIQQGVSLLEPPPGVRSPAIRTFGLALVTQGDLLGGDGISLGRPKEAAEYFERGFKIYGELVSGDASESESRLGYANSGQRLAGVLRHSDPHRAVVIYDDVLRRLGEVKNNSRARREEIRVLVKSTHALRRIGQSAEARRRLDTAFSRLRELRLYPAAQVELGSEPHDALCALADYEAASGNAVKAIGIYQELLSLAVASKPEPELRLNDALNLSNIYRAIAILYRRVGQARLARPFDTRSLELWLRWDQKLPHNSFVRRQIESDRQLSAVISFANFSLGSRFTK
jgi:tetratricopeptide (TPR) repeat protein